MEGVSQITILITECMGIATHALGYNFHLSVTEKLGYNHTKRWAIAALARQLIHMYSLEKFTMETPLKCATKLRYTP